MSESESSRPPQGEILRSNVDTVALPDATARPRRSFPIALVLAGLLLLVVGLGAGLLLSSAQQRPQQPRPSTPAAATTNLRSPSTSTAGTPLPAVNGISCDALESTIVHIHFHLAIFIDGAEQQVPFGIGIGQPWQVTDSNEGPFVDDGLCFYWIHTHTEDGIVHIESPIRRRFTLGDFFAIWQVPLSTTQIGTAQGQVITYVNGQRSSLNPADIALLPHSRIQLDVGADVPPYPFDFPSGV